jgi:hypothetical protein
MSQPMVIQGVVSMNLANFCPLPFAWAPYFLDFKSPYEALTLGCELMATMTDVGDRTQASPLLDWLQVACI